MSLILCFSLCGLFVLLPSFISPEEPPDGFFQHLQAQHQRNIEHKKHAALIKLFQHYKCPQLSFDVINDYLNAADTNNLDYRILPAISVQESSCGKHYPTRTHNLWGWNSAQSGFSSIPQGIDFVSKQLAGGRYYQGKSLIQKLRAYNPNAEYAPKIMALMKEMQ